jgi:hypothetical protein
LPPRHEKSAAVVPKVFEINPEFGSTLLAAVHQHLVAIFVQLLPFCILNQVPVVVNVPPKQPQMMNTNFHCTQCVLENFYLKLLRKSLKPLNQFRSTDILTSAPSTKGCRNGFL